MKVMVKKTIELLPKLFNRNPKERIALRDLKQSIISILSSADDTLIPSSSLDCVSTPTEVSDTSME